VDLLTDEQVGAYRRDGFVRGGKLLSDEQVQQLRAELDRLIAQYDKGHTGQVYIGDTAAFCQSRDCFLQFSNVWEISEPFRALTRDPRLLQALRTLLGAKSIRMFADNVLFKSGRNRAVNNWHQDGPSLDILREPDLATAWIALDDVGEGDGAVCFARGSHQWSEGPQAARKQLAEMDAAGARGADLREAHVRRGEVHFHHGLTWHCSRENLFGRPRRAFAAFYFPAATRFAGGGSHFFKRFAEVADGEPLAGRHFPLMPA
jgi:ectoine hydroxylase-related dioxygenase (phytanoyl-CoA dioxygenase family)